MSGSQEQISLDPREHATSAQRKKTANSDGNIIYVCQYCQSEVTGTTRFVAHLAGVAKGHAACVHVPLPVRTAFQASLAAKDAEARKRKALQEEQAHAKQRRESGAGASTSGAASNFTVRGGSCVLSCCDACRGDPACTAR